MIRTRKSDVLIILASRFDGGAASLAQRWRDKGARLLRCEDLSRRGWTWQPDAPQCGSLALEDESLPLAAVRGVVSLLSGIGASELPHIVAEDREYVASEMSAFLLAWLSSLPCPVINRPTPLCLTGPRLHHEQWLQQAARVGMRIRPSNRRIPCFTYRDSSSTRPLLQIDASANSDDAIVAVPIIAGRCLPPPSGAPLSATMEQGLQRLVAVTGAGLLTANLVAVEDEYAFAGAAPSVDVSRADVADALLAAFEDMP